MTSTGTNRISQTQWALAGVVVLVLAGMALDTKVVVIGSASDVKEVVFEPAAFGAKTFPAVTARAVDAVELAIAIAADAPAATAKYAVGGLMLRRTAFGRWLYASGGNARAAELSGVPVKRVQITVYILSGICASIAGLALSSQLTSAGPTAGQSYELTAIAAVVIGGAALTGGRGTIRGTMLGAFVIGFLSDGLVIIGVSSYWQTNNAQGAAMGASQWQTAVGDTAKYAELFGNPADNSAATRSNGYETVLTQDPGLEKVAKEVANRDRTQGHDKMQSMLQAHPEITGVIGGNDEMALGAIAALKEAGKLASVKVGGFDGAPDAVAAIKAGEMQYTMLQPVAVFSAQAIKEADAFIKTGKTGAATEKQLPDGLLITKDNVDKYTGPFVLAQ